MFTFVVLSTKFLKFGKFAKFFFLTPSLPFFFFAINLYQHQVTVSTFEVSYDFRLRVEIFIINKNRFSFASRVLFTGKRKSFLKPHKYLLLPDVGKAYLQQKKKMAYLPNLKKKLANLPNLENKKMKLVK